MNYLNKDLNAILVAIVKQLTVIYLYEFKYN